MDLEWGGGDDPSALRRDVVAKIRQQVLDRQLMLATPEFTGCQFIGTVKSCRVSQTGDLDITISVPPAEKYRAITLSDAMGLDVVFGAVPKRGGYTLNLGDDDAQDA